MNESHITVHGYVAATPIVRKVGEHSVANFRIGVTPRKLEKASGEWHDAETQWYAVSAWRNLGDNVGRSLRRGDPVIVQGRLTARTWINAQHQEVVAHDIEATFVGHDLRRGVSTFFKTASAEMPASSVSTVPPGAEGDDRLQSMAEPDMERLPSDLTSLIDGSGQDGATEAGEPPRETAGRADWSAPLQDAPAWSGAA